MLQSLAGKRLMVTRAADQAGEFSDMLAARGATVIECPTISLVPPDSWDELDAAIRELDGFDWLVLTSVNGVRFFFDRLRALGCDIGSLGSCKVCAVGPRTAELLQEQGIVPDLIAEPFTAEGVVAALAAVGISGQRVLFPRADAARDILMVELPRLGARLAAPVVYCNRVPEQLPQQARRALEQHELDMITFSASSTVRNLASLVGGASCLADLLEGVAVASIGPITSKTCQELGLIVAVEPSQSTLADLVVAVEHYFASR